VSAWRTHHSISEIGREPWQRLEVPNFPFADFAFLETLETSGSVGPGTGWQPLYLSHYEGELLQAAAILYLKTDSYGEYIFDWAWANAYARNGCDYYPKLVSAIPFTPATGPKLLVANSAPPKLRAELIERLACELRNRDLSSLHALFVNDQECTLYQDAGFLIRASCQFHWQDRGYKSFNEFLATLRQKKRKEVRRERRIVSEHGLEIQTLTGEAIRPEHMAAMYRFYRDTTDRKRGSAYLTAEFFANIATQMPNQVVLHLAREADGWVAGALGFRKGNALFGRHWGATAHYPCLHFELCYYQGIDFAIEHGLQLFEAGAQGAHKIQRGFSPVITRSAHLIADPRFAGAIAAFIEDEDACIVHELDEHQDAYRATDSSR